MIGGLAIVGTFLILRIASEFGAISIFALNLTTALGLGLAIDYSLFIVSRYREEIAKDGPGLAAMRRVLATSGRTVFFSSLTVSAALASLLVFPQSFLYSMGLGGSLVALFAALISLTVLPAVLTLLGTRSFAGAALPAAPRRGRHTARREGLLVPALALRDAAAGPGGDALGAAADRPRPAFLRDQVQHRRPQRAAEVGELAGADVGGQNHRFPPYRESPIWIALKGGGPKAAATMAAEARRVPGVAEVLPPQRLRNGVIAIQALTTGPFNSSVSEEALRRVRAIAPPPGTTAPVTGGTADFVDLQGSLARHLPIALAIVIIAASSSSS